ncbi:MAG TPA: hypothetical protein VGQ65_11590 [Thermoanaerobaculia bacterium]|nr:hypothetical protein [Thermoanaerobaculia bacterium]
MHPLSDIDVLLVRNQYRTALSADGNGIGPNQALEQVRAAVKAAYPKATTKLQSHSVNVELPDVDFGFDLVPAWLRSPDGYWIPDSDSGGWLATDPIAHNTLLTAANKDVEGVLKPTIKMVKHWNQQNLNLFRSFHLELVCKAILYKDLASKFYDLNVRLVLRSLETFVGVRMMDPVYGQSRVDKTLTPQEHSDLIFRIRGDSQRAEQAWTLESGGDHEGAIKLWQEVFISGFPS